MESLFLVICGLGSGVLLYWLGKKSATLLQRFLAIALYAWVCMGISFVYINHIGYHHQAATRGGIFFGIVAIVWAFMIARMMGFIGKKAIAHQ